jgi:malate synthase
MSMSAALSRPAEPDTARVAGTMGPEYEQILTPEALRFLSRLHQRFNDRRLELLRMRHERQLRIDAGERPGFLPETETLRRSAWRVASTPADLEDRRVEITGPTERKMMINALNSGASVFMADFEDSLSPTWDNIVRGQLNCRDAVRKALSFRSPEGKEYRLKEKLATLIVRPRGWHLPENHLRVEGQEMSGSLVDFGLYFFHNAHELLRRGSGPYFYLPKMESHLEARLWNEVFDFAEEELAIPRGTIRATVLIETILGAFEMDEILFELRTHASGLNAGRWDYIFSAIKKFSRDADVIFPDRGQVTMGVPFMRAYCDLLVATCHRRGAHAMGGMAAFIPSRRDPEINAMAIAQVREDKLRETNQGFDGTWVAHPDLVPIAREVFDQALGSRPNQKDRERPEVSVRAPELIDFRIPGGKVTEAGVRNNVNVALEYLDSWLRGVGAAAIHNLMEDAATAEISRAELWQWLKRGVVLEGGRRFDRELYQRIRDEELALLSDGGRTRIREAALLLDRLVLSPEFPEFLTLIAYDLLNQEEQPQ